ncbi:hypothetical protein Prudu_010129 [Prunus dulcis]|uniref:Uncharacterized protein n=1 Tax=Prunus dulcis TaxID=3755 RepID=A0A4Y1R7V1_PRUDU|nr:hypothetical protein Prudu_010129 [Prunus dulcis]
MKSHLPRSHFADSSAISSGSELSRSSAASLRLATPCNASSRLACAKLAKKMPLKDMALSFLISSGGPMKKCAICSITEDQNNVRDLPKAKDDLKRIEKEVDELTKRFVKTAEDLCEAKEKEIDLVLKDKKGTSLRTLLSRLESNHQSSKKRHAELFEQCNALKKGQEDFVRVSKRRT